MYFLLWLHFTLIKFIDNFIYLYITSLTEAHPVDCGHLMEFLIEIYIAFYKYSYFYKCY